MKNSSRKNEFLWLGPIPDLLKQFVIVSGNSQALVGKLLAVSTGAVA